jgi:uncharacterized protein (DUF3084 family)
MTLAILLVGLIVATCVIAYWADNLGKKLGKKRVSLKVGRYSLRPRQTATLISMLSSVGIMLLTLGFLLTVNKSIRNALLHYETVRWEANRAREQAEKARKEAEAATKNARQLAKAVEGEIASKRRLIASYDAQLEASQARLRATSTQLRQTQTLLAQARRAKSAAQSETARAARELSAAQRNAQQARSRLLQAQREFNTQRARLVAAQSLVRNAQQRLSVARRSLNTTTGALASTEEQLTQAQGEQLEARNRLQEAQGQLAKIQADFKRAEGEFKKTFAQYNEAVTNLEEVRTRRAELQTELDVKQREYQQLVFAARQLQTVANRLAYGEVAIREGDVFAEKTIAPRIAPSQARQSLLDLLEAGRAALQEENDSAEKESATNSNAQSKGATSNSDDSKIVLALEPLPFVVNGKNVFLQGDEIINQLANYLSTFEVPVSVRLAAARAHAVGERKIDVRFFPVPVRTIYRENEVLAETTVSASASDARVFNQLLALMNQGESAARAKGVMPVISTSSQFFYAGGTNERIFDALRRIQTLSATARVRLIAAQDLTTVEPLRVRIEVGREAGSDL